MKKFLVLYHASPAALREVMKNHNPKKHKEGMKKWMEWKKKSGKKVVAIGAPLGKGAKLSRSGNSKGTPSICGYSIVQAKDMNSAKKIFKGHPHLMWRKDCKVELIEVMKM